ncbi:MAG: hypothetical protein ABW185_06985 [Sedimenticola sp.]
MVQITLHYQIKGIMSWVVEMGICYRVFHHIMQMEHTVRSDQIRMVNYREAELGLDRESPISTVGDIGNINISDVTIVHLIRLVAPRRLIVTNDVYILINVGVGLYLDLRWIGPHPRKLLIT